MQTIRKRIKSSDYKEVERDGNVTIVRWDATPEVVNIPKGRPKRGQEQQYETKQTDHVVCTEAVFRGDVDKGILKAAIDKDLALRYPDGEAPTVSLLTLTD